MNKCILFLILKSYSSASFCVEGVARSLFYRWPYSICHGPDPEPVRLGTWAKTIYRIDDFFGFYNIAFLDLWEINISCLSPFIKILRNYDHMDLQQNFECTGHRKKLWVWKSIAQQEECEYVCNGEVLCDQGQKVYVISWKEHFLQFNSPEKLEM